MTGCFIYLIVSLFLLLIELYSGIARSHSWLGLELYDAEQLGELTKDINFGSQQQQCNGVRHQVNDFKFFEKSNFSLAGANWPVHVLSVV
jgi:hypothetical protein